MFLGNEKARHNIRKMGSAIYKIYRLRKKQSKILTLNKHCEDRGGQEMAISPIIAIIKVFIVYSMTIK